MFVGAVINTYENPNLERILWTPTIPKVAVVKYLALWHFIQLLVSVSFSECKSFGTVCIPLKSTVSHVHLICVETTTLGASSRFYADDVYMAFRLQTRVVKMSGVDIRGMSSLS